MLQFLQVHGAIMGSPVSLIVCNLYMEGFERPVLESATHPPHWWKHYVDDTHTVLLKPQVQEFIDHLNSINDNIKWITH